MIEHHHISSIRCQKPKIYAEILADDSSSQHRKRASGYYRQLIAENAIYRFKVMFGSKLRSRKLAQQITEARIKGSMLNRMAQLGMPDSYPVLAG